MSRPVVIGLIVMGLLTAVSVVYFLDTASQVQIADSPETEPSFSEPEPALYELTDPPIEIRIFFPTPNTDLLLRSRALTIFASKSPENRARQIIDHLIRGTDEPALYSALPDGTVLGQVFVSEDGTAYLDFNTAFADNHPGGILPEQATIYAIANSLIYNIEEIDRVKILVGGIERETLAGHCMLLVPFGLDLSLTDIGTATAAREDL